MVTEIYLLLLMCCVGFTESSVTGGSFRWKNRTETESFGQYLNRTYSSADKFYLLMGDTQYWFQCTRDNENCLRETKCLITDETYKNLTLLHHCQYLQGEYANRVQQKSIAQLELLLKHHTGSNVHGMIIDGDLVMSGYENETDRLRDQWISSFKNFPIYLGLGNHDYMNNLGQCPQNECVNKILSYFVDYVTNKLKFRLDMEMESRQENGVRKTNVSGSLSYSWDECFPSGGCFHFVQLNYFPYYEKLIKSKSTEWRITPSIVWLKRDLKANEGKPTFVNFHAFDHSFTHLENFTHSQKEDFLRDLNSLGGRIRIDAITFAHIHENVGIKDHWCINGRKVPLMYTGSVPGNNYVLVQFADAAGQRNNSHPPGVKFAYAVHAVNDTSYTVDKVDMRIRTC